MREPGLDLHVHETRYQELQDAIADDPDGALPDFVDMIHDMLEERGYFVHDPVADDGEEPEIVKSYRAAAEVAARRDRGDALDAEEVDDAIGMLRDVYETLAAEYPEPSTPKPPEDVRE